MVYVSSEFEKAVCQRLVEVSSHYENVKSLVFDEFSPYVETINNVSYVVTPFKGLYFTDFRYPFTHT